MDPNEMQREQEREESDRFLDEVSKAGAVKDLVEYKNDLKDKNIDHSNAHSEMRTYMSKRSNVQTFVHETYQEAKDIEGDIEQAEKNDRQLQGYIDDGWIPLQMYREKDEVIEKYKKILQYIEQQDEIQLMLLREVYEEMEKMRGADIAKEIMDEVKEFLNQTFEQKFDSDQEKMEIVQDTINDQIDGLEQKVERRVNNVREEMQEFDEREKKMLYFMAQNMNAMNNMAEQFQSEIDTREEMNKVPNEIAERMKELGVFTEMDSDLMKNMDKKQVKTEDDDESSEVDEDIEEDVDGERETSPEPDPSDQDKSKNTDESNSDSEKEQESDYSSDAGDAPDESPPETKNSSEDDQEDDQNDKNSEKGELVNQIPHSATKTVVDVARAIDAGNKDKDEIRDYLETKNPAVPTSQIKTMLKEEYVDKQDLPEKLVPE